MEQTNNFLDIEKLMAISNELLCVSGTDGYFKKVSTSFSKLLGYTEEELLSKPYYNFIHPDDLNATKTCVEDISKGTKVLIFENRFQCKDLNYKWFLWNSSSSTDQTLMYATAQDITVQKEIECRLKKTLEENQKILDRSIDIICTIDNDQKFKTVSKASEQLLGYKPKELEGQSFLNYVHPDDRQKTIKACSCLMGGKEGFAFENRCVKKDGSLAVMTWSGTRSVEDQVLFCIGRDETQKKQQEELLILNERRYKALVQAGTDLMGILDDQGIYKYVSATVTNVLGTQPELYLGKSALDFIHPDDRALVATSLRELAGIKAVEVPQFRFMDSKGDWRWLETEAINMLTDPAVNGIVYNCKDITKKRKAEEEKEKINLRLQNVLHTFTDGYLNLDNEWNIIDINPAACNIFNNSKESFQNANLVQIFPRLKESTVLDKFQFVLSQQIPLKAELYSPSLNKWLELSACPYNNYLTLFLKDITEPKIQQRILNLEKEVLQLNSFSEHSLKSVVDHYLLGIEHAFYNIKCVVCVITPDKSKLVPLSAPSLPKEYLSSIEEGMEIRPDLGACGAAAYFKEIFTIEDIVNHPNCVAFKDKAVDNNLLSCTSFPIFDNNKDIEATLAVYRDSRGPLNLKEKEAIKRICTFIQLLIDNHSAKENLLNINQRYQFITLASNDAIYDWDIRKDEIYWGEGFKKLFGYEESVTTLEAWGRRIHSEDEKRIEESLSQALGDKNVEFWHEEYRYQKADGSGAFIVENGYIIRNTEKEAVRMVGALQDISQIRLKELQILEQNTKLREVAFLNSHEIRRPLANILGGLELLKSCEATELQELLTMVEVSGIELDLITRQIAEKAITAEEKS